MPGTYQQTPGDNYVQEITDEGLGPEIDLALVTNGKFTLSGNRLIDKATGQIVTNLGQTGYNIFGVLDQNRLQVLSEVGISSLNTLRSGTTQTGVAGTTEITLPNGTVHELDIPFAYTAEVGSILAVHTTPEGLIEYDSYNTEGLSLQDIRAALPPDWRLATGTESALYALRGYINSNYGDIVDEVVEQGGLEGSTVEDLSTSEALLTLANMALDTVNAAVLRLYQF